MRRQHLIVWAVLASLALFAIAGSESLHQHDGLAKGDLGCPSCAATMLVLLVPVAIALKRATLERPRVHRALALVWPDTRTPYRLAARGPPAR